MSDNDRSVRRLTALMQSASTARVLNLLAVHRTIKDPDLVKAPFFQNNLLNRSLIVKHRLRPHEYAYFDMPKPTATKILIPIDGADLRVGARSVFVNQRDFDQAVEDVLGKDVRPGSRDRQVLDLIDELPSLDPFLLRQHLQSHDIHPARPYFSISDADIAKMLEFVRGEILALVTLSSGGGGGAQAYASRLVEKLLSNSPDAGFEPLKETLKLSDQEYLDGVFSWRGFLYYKWLLKDLGKPLGEVTRDMVTINGRGPASAEASTYLPEARRRIQASVAATISNASRMLDVYNKAYASLTTESKPVAFREFLLSAPSMFLSLGEQLGALQHVVSFWRYRFPNGRPKLITPDELMDVFLDFEDSMASMSDGARAA